MMRREFVQWLGRGGLALPFLQSGVLGCASDRGLSRTVSSELKNLPSLSPGRRDAITAVDGLSDYMIIKESDVINQAGARFGAGNDFLAYRPFSPQNPYEGFLWANHEGFNPLFTKGAGVSGVPKTREQVSAERKTVGGSILHVERSAAGRWQVKMNSPRNKRVDGESKFSFAGASEVAGEKSALGTLGNCCGGLTPWGSFLTAEENYHKFYGEAYFEDGKRIYKPAKGESAWDAVDPRPPEHYGWIVEVDPERPETSRKLISLGRFAHEGATLVQAKDGRLVVYMGDDARDEHFYKFVSAKPGSLEEGTLYVASVEQGRWLPLTLDNPKLAGRFKSHTDLMIRTREAAKLVGATPLDRPEDCEVDPVTGSVYLCCTNSEERPHGHILKLDERDRDFTNLYFKSSIFLKGGENRGISCPDNLAFDRKGNLWIVSDMPDDDDTGTYDEFGNNSLFYVPMSGPRTGMVHRMLIGPNDAELTGLWFAPDGETLFLSVQHPGDSSPNLKSLTSHWPEGKNSLPRSAVIGVTGNLMKELLS